MTSDRTKSPFGSTRCQTSREWWQQYAGKQRAGILLWRVGKYPSTMTCPLQYFANGKSWGSQTMSQTNQCWLLHALPFKAISVTEWHQENLPLPDRGSDLCIQCSTSGMTVSPTIWELSLDTLMYTGDYNLWYITHSCKWLLIIICIKVSPLLNYTPEFTFKGL